MPHHSTGALLIVGATALAVLSACSSGGAAGDANVEITYLGDNGDNAIASAEALIEEFESEHPDVTVNLDTRPAGAEGDNIIKTRLSTGEMADVFVYNSGSLFQALNPDSMLVDMSDQPWVDDLDEGFIRTVSTDSGIYGHAAGATMGGGILYNKAVYEDLGLDVPRDWDEFMANNATIADSGIDPVIQTYGETFSSQMFVLADFANVLAVDPDWAEQYTAGHRKYAEEPAVEAFRHHQEVYEAGYFNEDYASATVSDGVRMLADGTGAHYPITSNVIGDIEQNAPEAVDDIGFFAVPAENAADTQATIWQAAGLYIPRTTEGPEREAALEFIEFFNSDTGCAIQQEYGSPAGPYPGTCELPDDAPPVLTDLQAYVDDGRSAPALEFLSPVKGPNLEHIMVEVGSGIRSAEDAAARYDEDVINQARQLGLEGW